MDLVEKLLSERQIHYTGNEIIGKKKYDEINVMNQVDLIYDFHQKLSGIEGEYLLSIPSNIGKKIHKYRVQEKRNLRYFYTVKDEGASDLFDVMLIKYCKTIFDKADNILSEIEDNEIYKNLIYRSMSRNEISIGDTSLENLFFNEVLSINNIKKISLDMIEWDIINLILKCRRKNANIDEQKIIDKFLYKESLDDTSLKFINLMLDYPIDFMKLCERKRDKRKDYPLEYYLKRINNYINRREFK